MTETLLRLEYKPRAEQIHFAQLEKAYKEHSRMINSAETALNAARNFPELEELLWKLRSVDRQLKELLIGQADKTVAVNITGEHESTLDTLNDNDSSVSMVKRATAKRLARRLYALHHPDRGGDSGMFNMVRKAVETGDLETLYFFRMKDRIDACTREQVQTLRRQIEIKSHQFQGRPAWQITQAFYTNRERYVQIYKQALERKIYDLNMQMFGLTVSNSMESE